MPYVAVFDPKTKEAAGVNLWFVIKGFTVSDQGDPIKIVPSEGLRLDSVAFKLVVGWKYKCGVVEWLICQIALVRIVQYRVFTHSLIYSIYRKYTAKSQ